MQEPFTVTGMSCGGCESNVEDSVGALDGVESVDADHEADSVVVDTAEASVEDITAAIEDAGYQVEG
ncbi:heavy-metal-associated domain-containing protein [Halovenus salina]|uniref:Heavy-metal-associated domain-containing protein n=1 Tax=Halovenus salina TaxID=1510225 RepID=A0ABD5W4X1_9EURY|nr:heavy metal-associated domain-containing protein [Halovenus salina]